jgi:hypothetical protein
MSDNNNLCNPDTLPEDLILSDKELSKMICIVIANVELKRSIIRKYRELLEKIGVNKNRTIENPNSPEGLARMLLQEQLNKIKNTNSVDTQEQIFTNEEIEDIRKTLDKIKTASNKPPEKENNNTNQ